MDVEEKNMLKGFAKMSILVAAILGFGLFGDRLPELFLWATFDPETAGWKSF